MKIIYLFNKFYILGFVLYISGIGVYELVRVLEVFVLMGFIF